MLLMEKLQLIKLYTLDHISRAFPIRTLINAKPIAN